MPAVTMPCPVCGEALPLEATNGAEVNGQLQVRLGLSRAALDHIKAHVPDGPDDGEPQPRPDQEKRAA